MKGLFQCPPWAKSFWALPFPSAGDRWFRAYGHWLLLFSGRADKSGSVGLSPRPLY